VQKDFAQPTPSGIGRPQVRRYINDEESLYLFSKNIDGEGAKRIRNQYNIGQKQHWHHNEGVIALARVLVLNTSMTWIMEAS
jgi:predicted NUDIX family phosphoesterase